MKRKRSKRSVSFGSPPSVHAKKAKRLWREIVSKAETTRRMAEKGRCDLALFNYEDVIRSSAAFDTHVQSIGRHERSFMRAIGSPNHLRAQIAARKALEKHCNRPK